MGANCRSLPVVGPAGTAAGTAALSRRDVPAERRRDAALEFGRYYQALLHTHCIANYGAGAPRAQRPLLEPRWSRGPVSPAP